MNQQFGLEINQSHHSQFLFSLQLVGCAVFLTSTEVQNNQHVFKVSKTMFKASKTIYFEKEREAAVLVAN